VMPAGIVHSDATLVQVDVIFNPRVEPSIYERLNRKISRLNRVRAPSRVMLIRAIVVADHWTCQSFMMITYDNNDHVL
jgi:hypothetical protein